MGRPGVLHLEEETLKLTEWAVDSGERRTPNECSNIGEEVGKGSVENEGIRQGSEGLEEYESRDEKECTGDGNAGCNTLNDNECIDLFRCQTHDCD